MELSQAVLEGIRVAGSSSLDDKQFREVLTQALLALQRSDTSNKEGGIYGNLS